MSIHRRDVPDAPVRVIRSRLNPRFWVWMCWSNGTTTSSHQQRHTSWAAAFADAAEHRRLAHESPALAKVRRRLAAVEEVGPIATDRPAP